MLSSLLSKKKKKSVVISYISFPSIQKKNYKLYPKICKIAFHMTTGASEPTLTHIIDVN